MTRADMPPDPAAVIRALRTCRETMQQVQRRVRPSGPVYHGALLLLRRRLAAEARRTAAMVIASVDAFATLLTGERYYFSAEGSVAAEARRTALREQAAWERGEKPAERGDQD